MKITNIQQQIKQPNRYSIFVDGKYAFSLSESAVLESQIVKGQGITAADLKQFKQLSADDAAFGRTLRYVLMRPRSEWEVTEYLRRKDTPEPTARAIIDRLKNARMLDDAAFARSWVESRRLLKSTSRKRLQLELRQKRITETIIDDVLQEDRENTDEQQVLRSLIARKRSRYPDPQKLMAYLARQGYRYDDIKAALQEAEEN